MRIRSENEHLISFLIHSHVWMIQMAIGMKSRMISKEIKSHLLNDFKEIEIQGF